jgi:nucleotidyltransferase/DNA polymerase involved in DNA repair
MRRERQTYLFPLHGPDEDPPPARHRVIFCLDLNQFYVAVERRRRPDLVGVPVVIGADPKEGRGRGVVAAASYEARALGVKSAMPISWAWRRAPRAVYLRPDFDAYVDVSARVMERLRRAAPRLERASIDEAYMDVTAETGGDFERARALAVAIKGDLVESEGLACSIGVAPSKLVAKVASDVKKPDGLTVVRPGEVAAFLAPLEVGVLLGVGPKTRERLAEIGIRTCADLAGAEPAALAGAGFTEAHARALRLEATGVDDSEVVAHWDPRSIGRETTFDEDVGDAEVVLDTVADLADDVHARLVEDRFLARTVVLKLRYSDFETHTRRRTLEAATSDREVLASLARALAAPFLEGRKRVRLVGVQLTGLVRAPAGPRAAAAAPPGASAPPPGA